MLIILYRTSVRTFLVIQGNKLSLVHLHDSTHRSSFSSSCLLSTVTSGKTSVVGQMSPTVLHDDVVVESVTTTMVAEA